MLYKIKPTAQVWLWMRVVVHDPWPSRYPPPFQGDHNLGRPCLCIRRRRTVVRPGHFHHWKACPRNLLWNAGVFSNQKKKVYAQSSVLRYSRMLYTLGSVLFSVYSLVYNQTIMCRCTFTYKAQLTYMPSTCLSCFGDRLRTLNCPLNKTLCMRLCSQFS